MTAIHDVPNPSLPSEVRSVEAFLLLDPDDRYRLEAVDGRLMMAPSPRPGHARACLRLGAALDAQVPEGLVVLLDTDVDLQIESSGITIRRPDLVVCTVAALDRIAATGGILPASDVVLIGEVLSRSSGRIDRLHKRADYADARIPHYWLVELSDPIRLTRWELTPTCDYGDVGSDTGAVMVETPFRFSCDLDRLR